MDGPRDYQTKWSKFKNDKYHMLSCSCCCCSAAQLCLTLCHPTDYSTSGFPVLHLPPGVYSNSSPLSQWCLPTISSSVSPQSFPASGSFPLSWLFTLGGQSIGVSTSASVLQDWVVWSPCCPRDLSRVFSSTTVSKYQFFGAQLSLWSNSHGYVGLSSSSVDLVAPRHVGS